MRTDSNKQHTAGKSIEYTIKHCVFRFSTSASSGKFLEKTLKYASKMHFSLKIKGAPVLKYFSGAPKCFSCILHTSKHRANGIWTPWKIRGIFSWRIFALNLQYVTTNTFSLYFSKFMKNSTWKCVKTTHRLLENIYIIESERCSAPPHSYVTRNIK